MFSKICLLALQGKIKLGYLQYLLYLPGICGCVKPLHRPGLVFFNENSRKAFETLLWEVSTSTFPLHSQRKKTRQCHHKQQLSIVEEKLRQNQYRQHD